MKNINTIMAIIIFAVSVLGQTKSAKDQAKEFAKNGNYAEAIKILEEAVVDNKNDAELYFYLGYFSHYLAYDSRPLINYNINFSNKVLDYLYKAIQLNPGFGDAYYFIQAEFGARALNALQKGDLDKYVSSYREAFEKRSLPLWLIEYGKNLLKSCDDEAILFVGGDPEFNPVQYLQLIENYRRDVTVIPIPFLNRPWYIEKLKTGVENVLREAPIGLSKEQIIDMHPYKWDTLTIAIPVSEALKEKFKLQPDEIFEWQLHPNLKSGDKCLLDAGTAIFADLIETNKWNRAIHFSLGCSQSYLAGLDEYTQLCGITSKLLPFKTKTSNYKINTEKISEVLLNEENIKNFRDVDKYNMPRISNILMNYYGVLLRLAYYYEEINQQDKIKDIISLIESNLVTDVFPGCQKLLTELKEIGSH